MSTNQPRNPSQEKLELEIKLVPEIFEENFLSFMKNVSTDNIASKILNKLDVRESEKNYHKDLSSKLRHYISKEKERFKLIYEPTFFNDLPMFNTKEINSCVILLGTPFVEKSKQDKFKIYLTQKSVLTDFSTMVKNIIFPYEDSDKDSLGNSAMIIIELGSIEEAKLVKSHIDGKMIMKSNQGTALMFEEFLQILGNKNDSVNKLSLIQESHEWEKNTLEEFFVKRNENEFQLYNFHYMKKENEPQGKKFEISKTSQLKWSNNGTFLVNNNGSSIEFFTGNKELEKVAELPDNCQNYLISNDEKHVVTFLGLGNTNQISNTEYIRDLITRQNVFIWDILGTQLIKSIKIGNDENFNDFKFSADSKFLGRLKNDTLIIYEAPDFKMLIDTTFNNKRRPLTDKVTKYEWFPDKNYLMTINEVRKHKNLDCILEFYKIPERKKCDLSIPFTNVQIQSIKWHPSNKYLLLLLKTVNLAEWSLRIIEFNFNNFSHKSKSYELIKPVVRNTKQENFTEKDIDFTSLEVHWINGGNDIMISAKKRLLIPYYSRTEKKYLNSDNGMNISLLMYSFSPKDIKVASWPEEKQKRNMKFDSICMSPTGKNFVLFNKRFEERDSYGEANLYAIYDNEIHDIQRLNFEEKFSNIKFDNSGRFFGIEQSRIYMNDYLSKGLKLFYISGEMISDNIKDNTFIEVSSLLINYFYL